VSEKKKLTASQDVETLVTALSDARSQKKMWADQEQRVRDQLLGELGTGEFEITNQNGDIIALIQDVSTTRFSTSKFADDFPKFYEDYCSVTTSRKVSLVEDAGGVP
jgi:hypothetical protein